jgi:tetratricopeptide (TPR) repeat protein
MAGTVEFNRDIEELLKRIADTGMIFLERSGKEDIISTALSIPTLAERGYVDHAIRSSIKLLQYRDVTGGWDYPLTTIFCLEAIIGLKLRGISFDGQEEAIKYAIKTLYDTQTLETAEYELRLARVIVLVGLAAKDAKIIDSGLLRARSVLDREFGWSDELSIVLHGLLALADLFAVTLDSATRGIIDKTISDLRLGNEEYLKSFESAESLSRLGIIFEKLGNRTLSEKIYQSSVGLSSPEMLTTSSLKYRIELGARLYGKDVTEKIDIVQADNSYMVLEEDSEEQVTNFSYDKLPAYSLIKQNREKLSIIIVQKYSDDDVAGIVSSIMDRSDSEEIIVVWSGIKSNLNIPDIPGRITQIHADKNDSFQTRWRLGISSAAGTWSWIIDSSHAPDPLLTSELISAAKTSYDAIFFSRRDGDTERMFSNLHIKPPLGSSECLIKTDLLKKSMSDDYQSDMNDPFWLFLLSNSQDIKWKDVVFRDDTVKLPKVLLDDLDDRLNDTIIVRRLFRGKTNAQRTQQDKNIKELRSKSYDAYKVGGTPLVTIIIDNVFEIEAFEKCLQALIENTDMIPFEIIAVLDSETSEAMGKALDHLGVFVVEKLEISNSAIDRNLAVKSAKGKYLTFIDSQVEVGKGWLPASIHTFQEEESCAVVGSLLQSKDGKVNHAGVVFEKDGIPHKIHSGSPIVISHIHKRRLYQAVSGELLFTSKKRFQAVDGFREKFGNNFEDLDYCLRIRNSGYNVVYAPESTGTISSINCDEKSFGLRHFLDEWKNSVVPDIHHYAFLDGYECRIVKGKTTLFPKGKIMHTVSAESYQRSEDQPFKKDRSRILKSGTKPQDFAFDLATLISKADTLIKDGKFDSAEEALINGRNKINGNMSHRVMYWTLLGDARFRLNKWDEAYQCYMKAVEDDYSAERAWVGIGTYHLVKGELIQADEIFHKVVELNPDNLRGHLGLGNVQLRHGKPQDALPNFISATEIDPGYRPAIVGLVASAVQSEKMSDAEIPLNKYLNIHPDDNEARFHYAAVLFGQNDIRRSESQAKIVLETNPEHKGAIELITHIQNSQGRI